jgi:PsbP-like protein
MANLITIFAVVIMTALVLFATTQQQQQYAYAQIPGLLGSDNSNNNSPSENRASNNTAASSSNFVTYQSDKSGYTLQYPGDWSVHEYDTLNSVVISSPDKQASFSIHVREPEKFLDTNEMQVKIKTPHDLVIDRVNNMRQQMPQTATVEYDSYLRDRAVTIGSNSAWQLEYTAFTNLYFGGKTFYKTDYYITMPSNDGRVVWITFSVDQLDAPTYLPIMKQVINSIQFT